MSTELPADLVLSSGETFTTGSAKFLDHHPDVREPLSRIYVKFIPHGTELQFVGLLDTGGHYCILNENIVEEIEPSLVELVGETALNTAYGRLSGRLFLHEITLVAEAGQSLDVNALVFVVPGWRGPSFIGYTGVLDRISFAVQSRTNLFLFGD